VPGTFRTASRSTPWSLLAHGLFACALLLVLAGCRDAREPVGLEPDPDPVPDLDALFAPPTSEEINAVRADWDSRDAAPIDAKIEASEAWLLGGAPATLRVVSHAIEGGRHYGAVIAPNGAAAGSLPVLVLAHGGDQGVRTSDVGALTFVLGSVAAEFVWVIPSFRSEPLMTAERVWPSDGQASPWDRDVDDALALLGAALELTPAADEDRVGVLGLSRGAAVALLMGIRDPRIDRIVAFSGPTDFLGPFIRDVIEDELDGSPTNLPGLSTLGTRFVQPFAAGSLAVADLRMELVRRSAVLFAADLPPLQIHHGSLDAVVPVGEAHALIAALESLGRGPPDDGFFLYPGGGHDPLSMSGSVSLAVAFLQELVGATVASGVAARAPE
jgi:dipeptidyl aminopeptidase/acylaminoacyl peptidase